LRLEKKRFNSRDINQGVSKKKRANQLYFFAQKFFQDAEARHAGEYSRDWAAKHLFDLIYKDRKLKKEFERMHIYFYPAEGYATDNEYRSMYPERFTYDNLKKIFFWGDESRAWVEKNVAIHRDKLENTGYPRLRFAEVYAGIRDPRAPKKIGIIGRFLMLNDIDGMRAMKYILNEFTNGKAYQGISLQRLVAETQSTAMVLRTLQYIMAHTDISVTIRPHPNEDRRSYERLKEFYGSRVEISEEVDAAEWLAGCSKVIGLASSSYIDASLSNVPVICLDKLTNVVAETMAYEPALRLIYEIVYLPETFDQLTAYIDKDVEIKKSKIFDELMKTNFIGKHDDPIKHVADSIEYKPGNVWTWLIKVVLDAIDFILVTKDRLRGSIALDFDYSSVVHSENIRFVERYAGHELNGVLSQKREKA